MIGRAGANPNNMLIWFHGRSPPTRAVMIIPTLESYGFSTATAGFAVMALAIGNVTGRLLLGLVSD